MNLKIQNKHQTVSMQIKTLSEEGQFAGYGNVFGVVDHANDKTIPGAFKNSIEKWQKKGKFPRLLAQHGHKTMPIGVITSLKEDETGLAFEGKFCLDTQAGAEAHALVKMGAIDQFSIGYVTLKEKMVNGVNELHEIDVKEISLVTFACNEASVVTAVKDALESGKNPQRSVQQVLTECGVSNRQAEAAIDAIKSMSIIEAKEKESEQSVDAFKSRMKNHKPTVHFDLEVKDMSMSDYIQKITKAVKNSLMKEDRYVYTYDIYMKYVIMEVCDHSGGEYKEHFVRVPYEVKDDSVLVGEGEEVNRLVLWVNESENMEVMGAYDKKSDGQDDPQDDLPEVKSIDWVKELKELDHGDLGADDPVSDDDTAISAKDEDEALDNINWVQALSGLNAK